MGVVPGVGVAQLASAGAEGVSAVVFARAVINEWSRGQLLREDAFGGVLNFGVKGGNDPAVGSKVVDSLKLASNLANVGERGCM